MHLLPTRGRPEGLQRFFDAGVNQPGVVILDKDDAHNYDGVRYPKDWYKVVMDKRSGYGASANAGFNAYPFEPWYMMVSDDMVGVTPEWDTRLAQLTGEEAIVWPHDSYEGQCTFPCVRGDICREFGWFVHPTLWHMYTDTLWRDIQRVLGKGGLHAEIVIDHLHHTRGKSKYDDTYHGRRPPAEHGRLRKLGDRPFQGDYERYLQIDSKSLAESVRHLV